MEYDTCLITGGTGTFGTAYIISAIKNNWHKKIIIYSRDEYKQITMFNFLVELFKEETISAVTSPYSVRIGETNIRFFIGNVCDYERLRIATRGVDVVLHAAALKHVPICEYNPVEASKINIGGTINVVNASGANGVKRVISLSSDKAVDPINTYGATKLCLEKITLGGNRYYSETIMSVVRYGNIIGSRGSIIHKLLTHTGSSIDLTEPNMTRFWFSIEDAATLVRNVLSFNSKSVIYVPRLKSLRLADLFNIVRPDLKVNIIGSRPGEKMHEKMITESDLQNTYYNEKFDWFEIYADKNKEKNIEFKRYTSDSVEEITREAFLFKLKNSIINTIYGIKSL